MKIYFVRCATSDNYMMVVAKDGVRVSNCAPDGCWAGVSLCDYDHRLNRVGTTSLVKKLRAATDPDIRLDDLYWMGSPLWSSLEEWDAENATQALYNQDSRYLVGEYGADDVEEEIQ